MEQERLDNDQPELNVKEFLEVIVKAIVDNLREKFGIFVKIEQELMDKRQTEASKNSAYTVNIIRFGVIGIILILINFNLEEVFLHFKYFLFPFFTSSF